MKPAGRRWDPDSRPAGTATRAQSRASNFGGLVAAQFDEQDADDDQDDAGGHFAGQWVVEGEFGDDGGAGDADGRPDAVRDADGHAFLQGQGEQGERDGVAGEDRGDPLLDAQAVGDAQGHGGADFQGDGQ